MYLMPLQVFVALIVDNFVYPFSAVYSHFTQSINWSGVEYHLKDGKVDKVRNMMTVALLTSMKLRNSCHCVLSGAFYYCLSEKPA